MLPRLNHPHEKWQYLSTQKAHEVEKTVNPRTWIYLLLNHTLAQKFSKYVLSTCTSILHVLLEMQILRLYPRIRNQKRWAWAPALCVLASRPGNSVLCYNLQLNSLAHDMTIPSSNGQDQSIIVQCSGIVKHRSIVSNYIIVLVNQI